MYHETLTVDGDKPENNRRTDQKTPLLGKRMDTSEHKSVTHAETDRHELLPHQAGFKNYDDSDECTAIAELTLLVFCPVFSYVVVPILIVLTAGILGLYLFWKPALRGKWLYKKVMTVDEATHVLVTGADDNIEICELHSGFDD